MSVCQNLAVHLGQSNEVLSQFPLGATHASDLLTTTLLIHVEFVNKGLDFYLQMHPMWSDKTVLVEDY
jgi:hypothetical protein